MSIIMSYIIEFLNYFFIVFIFYLWYSIQKKDCFMEKSGRLSKNKCWEFNVKRACEVYLENKEIPKFKLSAEIREKVDHAGFFAELDLLWFYLEFSIYDSRHWDDKNQCFEKEKKKIKRGNK